MTQAHEPDHAEARRRRRLADIFGDVLPDGAAEDREDPDDRARRPATDAGEEWLRGQVPPHHG